MFGLQALEAFTSAHQAAGGLLFSALTQAGHEPDGVKKQNQVNICSHYIHRLVVRERFVHS